MGFMKHLLIFLLLLVPLNVFGQEFNFKATKMQVEHLTKGNWEVVCSYNSCKVQIEQLYFKVSITNGSDRTELFKVISEGEPMLNERGETEIFLICRQQHGEKCWMTYVLSADKKRETLTIVYPDRRFVYSN